MPNVSLLVILDGFGHSLETEHNAIALANTPTWDRFIAQRPHTLISGSGLDVGLPQGQMGNSEVGHMNLGSGRIVYQDFTRINRAIETGEFAHNPAFAEAFDNALKNESALHVMGLLSPGGVHSHEDQIFALIRAAADARASPRFICTLFSTVVIHHRAALWLRCRPPKTCSTSWTAVAY